MMPYHRAINGGWCGTVNELLNAQFTVHDTKVTPLTKPIKVKKLNMNWERYSSWP